MKSVYVVLLVSLLGAFAVVQGKWVPAAISLTADNAYAVYAGSSEGLVYLGSEYATSPAEIFDHPEYYPVGPFGKNDPTPAKSPLYLGEDQAIYIVAWSDAQDNQGLLANVVINGVQISPDNLEWQVYPTGGFPNPPVDNPPVAGCNPPYPMPHDRDVQYGEDHTAPFCPTWVMQMIQKADAEKAWTAPVRGDLNTPASFYERQVQGIPSANKWMWHNSSQCEDTVNVPFTTPRVRCHHEEPLLFKIPSTAAAADPTACAPVINGHFKYCSGQCPFSPDGASPQCATIYTPSGSLRECECCGMCSVVFMQNPMENYCTGYCPNQRCEQCLPSAYSYLDPSNPDTRYIKDCSCTPYPQGDLCHLDRCNNRCVGTCPIEGQLCREVFNSAGQLIDCRCPNITTPCAMKDGPSGVFCSGTCQNSDAQCKGIYDTTGHLKECTCDCCELHRDLNDQRNNRCFGRCDKLQVEKCEAASYASWFNPQDGAWYQVTDSCDCIPSGGPVTAGPGHPSS